MRASSKILAFALTLALQPAWADLVPLDFENEANPAPFKINGHYSGKGVTFSGDAWYVTSNSIDNGCKGDYDFYRAGSCGGLMLAKDATSPATSNSASFTLNLKDGFKEFSFLYSALSTAGLSFVAYSGADGTGKQLAEIIGDDPNNPLPGTGCASGGYLWCDWGTLGFTLSEVAMSIKVSGLDQNLMLDNLSFTTVTPDGRVPEPASIALALGALGAAGWARRRAGR